MKMIMDKDLQAIALGSSIYGTGGGGDPYIGRLLAEETLRVHGPVQLLELSEMNDDDWVASVALAGAPTVLLEKLADTDALIHSLQMLEQTMGKKAQAIFSAEVGGLNSVIPISVASKMNLPMLDCDTMGRAFPELDMTLATLAGLSVGPVALSDERGNQLFVQAADNRWAEKFVRTTLVQMGGAVHMALLPMTVGQLKNACVHGSISQAWKTGDALLQSKDTLINPVDAVLSATGGYLLHTGKVLDVQRHVKDGWTKGKFIMEGFAEFANMKVEVDFQNEFLIARSGDRMLCCTPDLISVLDYDTGMPITGEQLAYGYRLALLGIACVPAWRTASAIQLAGPAHFGYHDAYMPLESCLPKVNGVCAEPKAQHPAASR